MYSCDRSDQANYGQPSRRDSGEEETVTTGGKGKKKKEEYKIQCRARCTTASIGDSLQPVHSCSLWSNDDVGSNCSISECSRSCTLNIDGRRCRDRTTLLLDYFRTLKLVDFEPSISLTLCPSLLHKGHFFVCSEGLQYILAYKQTIFGWILRTKLWGSAYTRVMPHSHTLNSQSQSGIDH